MKIVKYFCDTDLEMLKKKKLFVRVSYTSNLLVEFQLI